MPVVPLPPSVCKHLSANAHPGLLLDKYVASWEPGATGDFSGAVQRPAVEAVAKLSQAPPAGLDWQDLAKRRAAFLDAVGAERLPCTTAGPLTLHLARASALENAGICLHPVYGFAYLPGGGLKGLARAFATTEGEGAADIAAVFGTTDDAGSVVFHDAWPAAWPRLVADLLNSHHKEYYGAKPGDTAHPPGDWEEPSMVSFLAVPAGVTFDFPLSKRRDDKEADQRLALARKWLLGGLIHLGAGAKTAAGYGTFHPVGAIPPAPALANRLSVEAILELVTPAFLAGQQQGPEDCDLRSATLRGLLRWWWRTLHAGFVDVATLRRMEAAVWGDTETGGAVRLVVEPFPDNKKPEPCGFKKLDKDSKNRDVLKFDDVFLKRHKLRPAERMSTQGLAYAAYGMDEMPVGKRHERKQRWFLPAGSRWRVRLTARASAFEGRPLGVKLILDQACLALWWFCRLGGAGAKARKGFGSFADVELPQFDGIKWLTLCKPFRAACGLPEQDFHAGLVASPSLGQMRNLANSLNMNPWLEMATRCPDPWRILDEIGEAMKAFAQAGTARGHGKHCDAKRHLGLPRKLHGPLSKKLPHQREWSPPIDLEAASGQRHAAPVWYHVAKGKDGLAVRIAAFPSAATRAPDTPAGEGWGESEALLRELLQYLAQSFAPGA